MTNPITVTYDDFAMWESNGSFNNGLAAGKTLDEVNYLKSGKRIALCELHEVPADSMTVTIAEGFQFAATYFDSDGLYLGGSAGYPGNSAWSSSTNRTINRPSSAKYWCVYLRRGAGTSELLPEHVMDACLAVTFDAGGGDSMSYLDSNGLSHVFSTLKKNLVAKSDEMLTTNPFAPKSKQGPYISKIDNAFYAAHKRWDVSATINGTAVSASSVAGWFDGSYEGGVQVAKSGTCVITMDFSNSTYFPGYPYGYVLVSFYYNQVPASVSGRVYCNYQSQGVGWHNISFSPLPDNDGTHCVYRSAHQDYYNISQLEITVVANDSNVARITEIEMHLDRPYSGRNPFLSKYAAETLYYNLTAPKFIGALQGNADTATNVTGTVAIANGGTGATTAAAAWTALGGGAIGKKASLAASDIPSHASSATTYGAGSSSNYGHVKLSDSTSASTDTTGGTAATPKAVKAAYDLANGANTTAGQALSAATGALAFKVTYSVSGSDVVCAAHVYSAGTEATSDHADSCFAWGMSLDGGATWASLGTGKTKTVSAMSTYGGNVKCDFTPAS